MKKNKVNWNEIKSDWKKVTFLTMLVVFLPLALYLLAIGQHLYFFLVAAVFYGLIQFVKSRN